ncbi:hypothetical protein AAKU55_002771 [Oxalobacteraceae bacterium GrIS 1.11]
MPASSSKIIVAAAILAGLLGAGAGTYYLRQHAAAPPGVSVGMQRATNTLMALPELQAWSAFIEKASGGQAHGALIETSPELRTVNGKRYRQLSFYESGVETAHRWESFLVAVDGDEILVEDDVNDKLMSLERWRKQSHPLQRIKK